VRFAYWRRIKGMIKVAINGFGRIGRTFFRQAFGHPDLEFVAINDLTDEENLAYLLKYDTVYGRYDKSVETAEEDGKKYLVVDGKKILSLAEREPENLPWKDLDIDVVVESTGFFASDEGSQKHAKAGAKKVVITAPAKGAVQHVLIGSNPEKIKENVVISNASCTTNCAGPVAEVMMADPGVEKALLTTVHGYTSSQSLVDAPGKKGDFRRGRAAAQNMVPSHTGAAEAVAKAIPVYEGIFTGIAIRVPVVTGSIVDFTFLAKRDTSAEEINDIFKKAANEERWKGILEVSDEPLVSTDIIGREAGAIIDLEFTRVVGGNLVKVLAWYDNEWGYSAMLTKVVVEAGKSLGK